MKMLFLPFNISSNEASDNVICTIGFKFYDIIQVYKTRMYITVIYIINIYIYNYNIRLCKCSVSSNMFYLCFAPT